MPYRHSYVPTEINSSYQPAGDDAARGFVWNYQYYDWKDRVVRTRPSDSANDTDGKDTLITYDGCGCAGGQITTVQGALVPRDDQATINARRTQKVYEDSLGRAYKTEMLDWTGAVYLRTEDDFNGRDQTIQTDQTAIATSAVQVTTATFDGHGRLKTRHLPQQNTGSVTTYNYNADDSVASITDARGAVASYTYNNRRRITNVGWSVPGGSGISDPADANFSYDNVGNTTQMTDGLGSESYSYDSLSRMTSETRILTGVGTYSLNYGYGLYNSLTSITFPNEATRTVGYSFDKLGRLTNVRAGGMGGVYTYADQFAYRSFGGVKGMRYGSNEMRWSNVAGHETLGRMRV